MKLEGVVTCVNYSDFLAETLPMNREHFDRLVVVTAPEDIETLRVCDFWECDVVLSDVFRSRWGEFHKAKGINAGLEYLERDGWVLHFDADIAFPPRTRTVLSHAGLDRSVLHGADRLRVPNHAAWREHLAFPQTQHDGYHVRLDSFEMMARFNAWHLKGYAPPGYFQLWHPGVSGVDHYPDEHTQADRTDVLFSGLWERHKRALVPELAVYHLESEPSEQGTNWAGRKTARFGVPPAADRKQPHSRHRHHRHHHHDPDPYGEEALPPPLRPRWGYDPDN